jgi:DNA-binding LacI/PurR family transcriptional regulator
MLIQLIRNEQVPDRHVLLQPNLIIRESSQAVEGLESGRVHDP